jgi:arabinose-5-phosphate isomerase|tara:strand:+ start:5886 stop:6833 length:948 start_codon:yes stop_codon:yes gene_type:complete
MINQKYIKLAKETIEIEIKGLKALLDYFGADFCNAIDLILNCKGRVIFSGIGKSGHIANKISATLASTGTTSFFIHPSEASHGDLGMITKNDVVILLSNSGETKELTDIIYYCQNNKIPLIAIVRRVGSDLVDISNVSLILPNIEEANFVNAPTTSTTMMIALGDAIASVLMNVKNFSKNQYGAFHPGGKLGSELTKIAKVMRIGNNIPIVNLDENISNVLLEMTSKHLGCTAVIDNNKTLIGIVTDGDLRRHLVDDKNFMNLKAKDVMTKNPCNMKEDELVISAKEFFHNKKITSIFIINENKNVKGIVHIHDI